MIYAKFVTPNMILPITHTCNTKKWYPRKAVFLRIPFFVLQVCVIILYLALHKFSINDLHDTVR